MNLRHFGGIRPKNTHFEFYGVYLRTFMMSAGRYDGATDIKTGRGKKSGMSKILEELAVEIKPAPAKRIRRSAEESRRVILDAAAKRLAEQGPEGIRLQDIARDVGISHPAILHHFESRAGLVNALVDRTTSQLKEKLLGVLEGENDQKVESQMPSLVNNTFEALSDQGTAKLLSWMLLTDAKPKGNPTSDVMSEIADRGHAARCKLADSENLPHPDREETMFLVLLIANSAFGEAVVGDYFYDACGFDGDADAPRRFRKWLGEMLGAYSLPEGCKPVQS
jgi:AcrR family transcriptional regulator